MSNKNYISIREYARRRECSDTAVHKAYKDGHLNDDAFAWTKNKTRKKGIYPDVADAQWAQTIDTTRAKNAKLAEKILNSAKETAGPSDEEMNAGSAQIGGSSNGSPSKADAQRIDSIFKAKLRELEYKQKKGELVNRDKVYNALFGAGQELRDAMLAIPDRIIDEVLAAATRNEAHEVLRVAIHSELERLSEIEGRELG